MLESIIRMGVDFREAPLSVREQWSFTREEAGRFLEGLARRRRLDGEPAEALLLSTCNRTELYLVSRLGAAVGARIADELESLRPEAALLAAPCLRCREQGDRAVERLFRVAAGLESQLLGDSHIAGQLRQAAESARAKGLLGRVLESAVVGALRAARRVRSETGLAAGAPGVGAAVLRSIRRHCGDLRLAKVLVLGAGGAASDIAHHLSKARPAELWFAARRSEQAVRLARRFQGRAAVWKGCMELLAGVDVVVGATSGRLELLSCENLRRVCERRQGKPLLVIDAGVPRNAQPEAALLSGVVVVDIDCLDQEQQRRLALRRTQIPAAEQIVAEEVLRWKRRLEWLQIEPAIKELYLRAEQVRRRLLDEDKNRRCAEELTRLLVRRLLDGPVRRLRRAVICGGQRAEDFQGVASALGCITQTPALAGPAPTSSQFEVCQAYVESYGH